MLGTYNSVEVAGMETVTKQLASEIGGLLPKIGMGLLMLFAFGLAGHLLQRVIRRMGLSTNPSKQDVFVLMGQITKIGLYILGTVTALGTMGVNVSAVVAGLGLTGFALGFAFRDTLSNILAGILILMYQPFHGSDHIAVAGLEGTVEGIDLRYTTLITEDKRFLIPNSLLFSNPITLSRQKAPQVQAGMQWSDGDRVFHDR
jgi:small conductance mechanosensitive channel